ncbi:hypothetical protein Tco_0653161 [Tanacetum coccineum]|uniref:Uncharacterized protein n=1 Tax=Tanacetum coccineum TaxID=301880 RepID=A0ABQ4WZM4_9ASTR
MENRYTSPKKMVYFSQWKIGILFPSKMVYFSQWKTGILLPSKWYTSHNGKLVYFCQANGILLPSKWYTSPNGKLNFIRKFLKAPHPKWRAKVTTIEESKDLTSLSLDELIRNLKAKKESSDKESSTFENEDKECAMAVRDCKKFFKRRGRFVRQPWNDKKTFQRSQDDKNGKGDRNDSGEVDDEKAKDETYLMSHPSSELHSESSYFSDENSSIDDFTLDNEYKKL